MELYLSMWMWINILVFTYICTLVQVKYGYSNVLHTVLYRQNLDMVCDGTPLDFMQTTADVIKCSMICGSLGTVCAGFNYAGGVCHFFMPGDNNMQAETGMKCVSQNAGMLHN